MRVNSQSGNFALESEVSGLVSSKRAGPQNGKSSLTTLTGLALPTDFLTPANLRTYLTGGGTSSAPLRASALDHLVRIYRSWGILSGTNRDPVLTAAVADSSSKSWKLSDHWSRAGSFLKTCQISSIQTTVEIYKKSYGRLPNAVTWDTADCSMRNISECPRNVVAWSWSQVLDECPHPSSWLTPGQWNRYLARLVRNKTPEEVIHGQVILLRRRTNTTDATAALTWVVKPLLLKRTDGVRLLSGAERLSYMGFPRDWMHKTLSRLMPQAIHSRPQWLAGSLKF